MAVLFHHVECHSHLVVEEEVVNLLANQRPRCFIQCAGAVEQIFHVQYVVSGGGHSHLCETEVSCALRCVHVIKIHHFIAECLYGSTTQRAGVVFVVITFAIHEC